MEKCALKRGIKGGLAERKVAVAENKHENYLDLNHLFYFRSWLAWLIKCRPTLSNHLYPLHPSYAAAAENHLAPHHSPYLSKVKTHVIKSIMAAGKLS